KAHLGGALGAAMLTAFIRRGWIKRQLESRELQLTASGKKALKAHFDLTV
ncbi:MAG: transcriptional regulator, partial [Serratia liquefaciens]|nr:transcriptional regulator [Serratia liquefaciens]